MLKSMTGGQLAQSVKSPKLKMNWAIANMAVVPRHPEHTPVDVGIQGVGFYKDLSPVLWQLALDWGIVTSTIHSMMVSPRRN